MSSLTLQAIHFSSVTRATAANPMPVVWQTTSRIVDTTGIRPIASISARTLFGLEPEHAVFESLQALVDDLERCFYLRVEGE
jgi:hypothetical protein